MIDAIIRWAVWFAWASAMVYGGLRIAAPLSGWPPLSLIQAAIVVSLAWAVLFAHAIVMQPNPRVKEPPSEE